MASARRGRCASTTPTAPMPSDSFRKTHTGWPATSAASAFGPPTRSRVKLGIEKTALIRVRAGISFALAEAMDDGHCGLPHEELLALTRQLLEVPAELVETALSLELQEGAAI